MNYKHIFFVVFVLLLTVFGCASTNYSDQKNQGPAVDIATLKSEITLANNYLDNADPEKALSAYQMILENHPDLPARYQCGVLTNAALASLQMGDGRRFADYARRLETAASDVKPLPRNTQVVLAMMQTRGLGTTDAELWITHPVETAVRAALNAN